MNIERFLIQDLIRWKDSPRRKPLILNGVRQCGKTWLLKYFGQHYFEDFAYFNFEHSSEILSFFDGSYDPSKIITQLSAFANKQILPQKTLVIFDEIQVCPRALVSLKYFCEDAPEYAIASAGSLLGISIAAKEGFPVGKVSILDMSPCSFKEYVHASAPMLVKHIETVPLEPLPDAFASRLTEYLREYLTFGGMPEVASIFLDERNIDDTEETLRNVLENFKKDFMKHIPARDIPKLSMIWNSIPVQFARENKRFIFGEVRKGARAKDLEDALQWLVDASMVIKVNQVEKPEIPLKGFEDRKLFKLYPSDVGVLRKLAEILPNIPLNTPDIFSEFNGKIAENYVLEQLKAMHISPISYWTNPIGKAEVDFLIQSDQGVIPIEVKSGTNLNAKSLRIYREKYSPKLSVRFSMQNLRLDGGLLNIPLYLIGEFPRLMKLAMERVGG